MSFFKGGISYDQLCNMPISDFAKIIDKANKIDAKIKAEMGK